MSKTYRCKVRVDLKERVRARDAVEYEIDLGRVLGKQEEGELWRQKLREAGGVEKDGKIALDVGGVAVEVDPATGKVTAEVKADDDVEVHLDEERRVWNAQDSAEAAQKRAQATAEQEARERMAAEKTAAQGALDGHVRGQLGRAAPEIVRRLREVRAEVEKEAVVRKAQRLGTVLGTHESRDEATGDRTLTVDVELPDRA
ncbi:MAG: hypothetical protein JXP73_16080 [Deltaproteobacteria bacterium]|nr:hypothetical protein [Deltaproteobacteria bacterium]